MRYKTITIALAGMLLYGCVTPSPQRTMQSSDWKLPEKEGPSPILRDLPSPKNVNSLTLKQAFKLGESHHPDLAAARERIQAAEARALQAGLLPNPELVARMESAPFRGRTTGQAEYVIGASQKISVSRRLSSARRVEELESQRLMARFEARRREVEKGIHGAFATALYTEEVTQMLSDLARRSEEIVSIAKARLATGDAVPGEVARGEMEEARSKLKLQQARFLREQAIEALSAAMGGPDFKIKSMEGNLEETLEVPALEALSARLEQNPLLLAAEADVAAQEARLKLAESERIPDVNLDFFYRRLEDSNQDAFDMGISIPLPIFNRNQGRLREAQAHLARSQARIRSTRKDLEFELRDSHLQMARALKTAQILREDVLPRAEVLRQLTSTQYQGGEISLLDSLLAEKDWLAARLEYLESLHDVLQAWARMASLLR